MKSRFATTVSVLALVLSTGFLYVAPSPAFAASNDCTAETNPFSVTGVTWGTPSSPVGAYPGEQGVPLTVSMLFLGPCTSPQTTLYLDLNQGVLTGTFTGPNGQEVPSVLFLNTSPNALVTETFYLNINQNAQVGITYYIPLTIQYSDNSASDIITQGNSTTGALVAPIALYGAVQLAYSPSTTHLVAGQENNVTLTLTNTGAGSSGPVTTTVSAASGVTVLNQLPVTSSLAPGAQATQLLELFVGSSLGGGAVVLTLISKYLDQYNIAETATNTLGFTVPTGSTGEGASTFVVTSSSWGSASSSTSPLPGTQDEPLVVGLQYLGSAAVTSLQGTLQLPAGVTNLNGGSTATAYSASSTNQYGTLQLTFYVDLASSVKAGTYNFTLSLDWMTASSAGLTESTLVTPPPVGQLQSSFQVEGATWQKSANASASATSTSPVPGSVDAPLVVTLQYLGTTSVSDIEGILTLPAGFTDLNGNPTATAFTATATANQVVTLTFYVDVASSVKPGSFSFPLALSWQTAVGVGMTQSATVSPPPVSSPSTSSFPLSIAQANATITAGSQSSSSFTLTNEGAASIYSPTFTLQVSSPVVLASAGSPVPTTALAPGASATFQAQLTAGPSATPGIYGGTLTVAFTDSSGTSHTQSFPLSFTVEGTVILIIQDSSISQSSTGFTVTGSILNEGSVAAYYASITGLIEGATTTPVYIGEIDPNTPTPFSLTIPFTAPATAPASGNSSAVTVSTRTGTGARSFSLPGNFTARSFTFNGTLGSGVFGGPGGGLRSSSSNATAGSAVIALTLAYKDTFGSSKSQAFSLPTTVKTASELSGGQATVTRSTTTGTSDLTYAAYAVVAILLLTLVAGSVMVRRYRARRVAEMPTEDKAVI